MNVLGLKRDSPTAKKIFKWRKRFLNSNSSLASFFYFDNILSQKGSLYIAGCNYFEYFYGIWNVTLQSKNVQMMQLKFKRQKYNKKSLNWITLFVLNYQFFLNLFNFPI